MSQSGPLVSPAIAIIELYAGSYLTLTPHLLGSHSSNCSVTFQMSQILYFQPILKLDLR